LVGGRFAAPDLTHEFPRLDGQLSVFQSSFSGQFQTQKERDPETERWSDLRSVINQRGTKTEQKSVLAG
jgi:hypothetical protein